MRLYSASILLLLAAPLAASLGPGQTGSAVARFQNLRATLKASHDAKDWQSNLSSAIALKEFLNQSPTTHLEVARAEMHLGDAAAAHHEIEQFVHMGQSSDFVSRSTEFGDLRSTPEFPKIQTGMEANRQPVSLGSIAFPLPDSGLLPEDVDYDSATHRFLITSVHEHKIVAIETTASVPTSQNLPITGR
jgi:hypothetical protein